VEGFYVLTNRFDCFDSLNHLPFLPVSTKSGRRSQSSLSLLLLLFLGHFALYGCVQRGHVEAATELPPDVSAISEKDFMVQATEAHLADLNMVRLARMHSQDAAVKRYAGTVFKDRQESLELLTALMRKKEIAQPDTLNANAKQDIDRMAILYGSEFDREFINMMVAGHEKTLELFRSVSVAAHDPAVQDYVDGMIPKLDKDLKRAQELQSKLFSHPQNRVRSGNVT
jgi:putative membrane protein